jgi:hypothetical protein
MTSTIEPGSREDYLRLLNEGVELPHSRSWYEADGLVEMNAFDLSRLAVRRATVALHRALGPVAAPALGYMLDYAGARPDLVVAKHTGAVVISRYIAPPIASTAWKRIGVTERDSILRIIGDLWLNWEWYAGRMLEGSAAGTEDGRWAYSAASGLAYPHGRVIVASHDTGTINDPATLAYCSAFNAQLRGDYKLTIYGSFHTTTSHAGKSGVQRVPWQTKAWSGSNKDANAAVFQNTNQWFNHTVDENEIWHSPFGTWNKPYPKPTPPPTPTPTPTPTPDDEMDVIMSYYANKAAFEAAQLNLNVRAILTALWGDPQAGITPAMQNSYDHGRASLGIYDAMSFFSRGKLIKFSKDPKAPSAVYVWNGSDRLIWINSAELAALQRVASPDPKGKTYNYALNTVVDMPITGQVYKLQVADGTVDPRITAVSTEELNYDETANVVVPFESVSLPDDEEGV